MFLSTKSRKLNHVLATTKTDQKKSATIFNVSGLPLISNSNAATLKIFDREARFA